MSGEIWGVEGRHLWVPPYPREQLLRTNLATNPRVGTNATGWSALTGAVGVRATGLAATPAGSTTGYQVDTNANAEEGAFTFNVTNGIQYTVSVYERTGVRDAGTAVDLRICNAAGTQKAIQSGIGASAGSWTRYSFTFTADSTGAWTLRIRQNSGGAGDSFTEYLTDVLVEAAATMLPYFSGASLPSGSTTGDSVAWTGTADASTSEFTTGWTAAEVAAAYYAGTNPFGAPVILNRRLNDAGTAYLWPVYWVHKIGGLASLGESDDARSNRVGAQGEIPRRAYRRGKTITYEGTIRAQTRASLRTAEATLRAAMTDQSMEGVVLVTPHPVYDTTPGVYRYYPARLLTAEISDEITTSPAKPSHGHESGFVVALRNSRAGGFSYFDQAGVGYP